MGQESERDLTRLLAEVSAGRSGASDELAAAVYDDLRAMAERRLVRKLGRDLAGLTIHTISKTD